MSKSKYCLETFQRYSKKVYCFNDACYAIKQSISMYVLVGEPRYLRIFPSDFCLPSLESRFQENISQMTSYHSYSHIVFLQCRLRLPVVTNQ